MEIDPYQLPIPDWGLECPGCHYLLRGLTVHRCPECGYELKMEQLIQPWTRIRPPHFTGDELPMPDFGLHCFDCGAALAGAVTHNCPACGVPFDPEAWRPTRPWFVLDRGLLDDVPVTSIQALLATEHVPYLPLNDRTLTEIVWGHSPINDRLNVASEFFFEVRYMIQQAKQQLLERRAAANDGAEWMCPVCAESNPAHFEICWNCGTPRGAAADEAQP